MRASRSIVGPLIGVLLAGACASATESGSGVLAPPVETTVAPTPTARVRVPVPTLLPVATPPPRGERGVTTEVTTVLAASVADLARAWDTVNRVTYERDVAASQRVAAELEQFSVTVVDIEGGASSIFWARLNERAVLAGTLDDAGQVIEVVGVARRINSRDRQVAVTTLEFLTGDGPDSAARARALIEGGEGFGAVEGRFGPVSIEVSADLAVVAAPADRDSRARTSALVDALVSLAGI